MKMYETTASPAMQSGVTGSLFRILVLPLAGVTLLAMAGEAEAIPPPELVRIGSVFVQVLAFILIAFSTVVFFIRRRLEALFAAAQRRRAGLGLCASLLACGLAALLISSLYVDQKNRQILATTPAAQNTANVEGGVVTVAGVEFDIADPSLAIKPREVQSLLNDGNYLFIDIRESVEFSTRHITGFRNIRAGDLLAGRAHESFDKGKTVILACEAGERGSAIAVFLRVRGLQARYIEGGIRGWLESDLPISGNRTMQLPDFDNKYAKVTLDVAKQQQANGRATLVDVRTPKDFAQSHIDGAVNIPLVNMPTLTLEKAFAALPADRPVIGVAYDRFGAYYSLIVGHMLTERGLSYGGTLIIPPQGQAL